MGKKGNSGASPPTHVGTPVLIPKPENMLFIDILYNNRFWRSPQWMMLELVEV